MNGYDWDFADTHRKLQKTDPEETSNMKLTEDDDDEACKTQSTRSTYKDGRSSSDLYFTHHEEIAEKQT